MRLLTTVLVFMAWLVPSAALAEGPDGIAFVVAPENSYGYCVAGNPDAAFACAREKCVAAGQGIGPSDCYRVKWCFPAMWSGDLFWQNADGFHSHDYLCGLQSRAELEAVVKAICGSEDRKDYLECSLVQVFDPDGKELMDN